MRKILVVAVLAATCLAAQTKPAPVAAKPAPRPANPVRLITLPPGWGLAPGPASTVTHPGGLTSYTSPYYYRVVYVPTYVAYYVPADPQQQQQQVVEQPVAEQPVDPPPSTITTYTGYDQTPTPPPAPPPPPTPVADPPAERAAATTTSYTLLVFKDHSIFAATDYWVENNRLSYVTSFGKSSSIALDQLDLEFTLKLNNERNVKFELREK